MPAGILGFALLGLLAAKARTGYELAQAMKAPIGYLWSAQHSQIYPTLARLQTAGFVTAVVIDGPGPRDNKRYSITASGRQGLEDWTDSALIEVSRSELMLRIRCLWLLSPDRARRFVLTVRRSYEERQETYAYEQASFALVEGAVDDPSSPYFAQHATLEYGMMRASDTIAWCDWLLGRLEPPGADRAITETLRRSEHPDPGHEGSNASTGARPSAAPGNPFEDS